MNILEIKDLEISFNGNKVVKDISLNIESGQSYALVGESGSGKSVTCSSILQLLPETAKVKGSIKYNGTEINDDNSPIQQLRGKEIAYIPQSPITSLNPVKSVLSQMKETVKLYKPDLKDSEIIDFCKQLLNDVQLYDHEKVFNSFPFELSGGMCQRVMIALALAGDPKLLLADEPTTALDVTIQAEIMSLLMETATKRQLTMLLITHDLPLVAQTCSKVAVIKNGEIREVGELKCVFNDPQDEYTKELLAVASL